MVKSDKQLLRHALKQENNYFRGQINYYCVLNTVLLNSNSELKFTQTLL